MMERWAKISCKNATVGKNGLSNRYQRTVPGNSHSDLLPINIGVPLGLGFETALVQCMD